MPERRTLLNHPLVHQMRRTIEQYEMLDRQGQRVVIVALSGGADSTALLWGLSLLGYRCVAAHCNFHLRGSESDRDEAFVSRLCQQLKIPLERASFDTYGYAASHKGKSIEMAARELRYRYFDQLYDRYGAQSIVLGHHLEDNIEQLLINLSQGAGIRGLRGMLPSRDDGKYIRPLIDTPPSIIHDFLRTAGQEFVTDSTNTDTTIRRNFVRHSLRPLFNRLNPSFDSATASTIYILRDLEQIYNHYIRNTLPEESPLVVKIDWLRNQVAPLALLYNCFESIDCDRLVLQQILRDSLPLERSDSKACYQGRRGIIERYRGYLIGTTSDTLELLEAAKRCTLALPPVKSWLRGPSLTHPVGIITIAVHETCKTPIPNPKSLSPYSYIADYDQLLAQDTQLQISASTDGNQLFTPMGLRGRKQLTKLLRDAKVLPSRRAATPQLTNLNSGESLWLIGLCRSISYPITESTRRWVEIHFAATLADPFGPRRP